MEKKREYIEIDSSDDESHNEIIQILFKKTKTEQSTAAIPSSLFLSSESLLKTTIKIIHWNINGLRRIIQTGCLQKLFNTMKPDILCLNEIKMTETKIHEYRIITWIPQNHFYYLNCCKGKGSHGVGIISGLKPKSIHYGMGIEKHDREARLITLEFDKFYIVSCYFPFSGDRPERFTYRTKEWDPDFRNYVRKLKAVKTTILCGDLNVAHTDLDVHNPNLPIGLSSTTKEERENFEELIKDGFVDVFREKNPRVKKYTFFSNLFNGKKLKRGWRLDYFLIDKEGMKNVLNTEIFDDVDGSDHCPIEMIYSLD